LRSWDFLNVFSECRKCYFRSFRDSDFKNFLGGDAPSFNPLANSCLRYSAHTFGDRILCWERARKMGPLAVLPHHWRILKKCTALLCRLAPSGRLVSLAGFSFAFRAKPVEKMWLLTTGRRICAISNLAWLSEVYLKIWNNKCDALIDMCRITFHWHVSFKILGTRLVSFQVQQSVYILYIDQRYRSIFGSVNSVWQSVWRYK
jgi:hypothetical protein